MNANPAVAEGAVIQIPTQCRQVKTAFRRSTVVTVETVVFDDPVQWLRYFASVQSLHQHADKQPYAAAQQARPNRFSPVRFRQAD